ncbi:amino acid adenylation domain-containing protein [Streptomyces sp. NPDC086549]|uniref:amino acid adenylation domain-containing protein n=1 Tax=Streptomyces sp. NPDC086549 TaxID=3365752 RepID=UPI003829D91C
MNTEPTMTSAPSVPAHAFGRKSRIPHDTTVHRLFLRWADATPDAPAVISGAGTLTYRQLADRSARLARRLLAHGVRRGELVAVRAERSAEWVIANLAVLRAGAAYLPISPAEPAQRVELLLEDGGVRLVLGDREAELPGGRGRELSVAQDLDAEAGLPLDTAATDRAYVMYTSGSTGRPKGVVVCHRNIARLVTDADFVEFSDRMRVLQTGAVSFDASTFEMWGPLLNGGVLVLPGEDVILHADRLGAALSEHRITTMWLTSPLFSRLVRQDPGIFAPLRDLIVGGDVVAPEHVAAVQGAAPGTRIVNGYGPTENTTFSTTHLILPEQGAGPIPIGRPIANSSAYVLDPEGVPLPPGTIGELYVGGDGVALGYLNRPELTEAVFLPDPFLPGGRMYRTGDLVRQRADGVIEFHGRADGQVKIRGYRIEPGEIESVLRGHPLVSEATVVPRVRAGDDPADRYLAAYVTTTGATDVPELRAYLADQLPRHLIPGHLVVVDELPLTAHGKVDRSALPDPEELYDLPVEYVAPRDATEERLVAIWERLLPNTTVGVLDSMFDHGVDSLTAATLAAAVSKEFGTTLALSDVFRNPTVEELAEFLAEHTTEPGGLPALSVAPSAAHHPLAPQQHPLYVEQSKETSSVRYNVPVLLEIPEDTDADRLAAAWRALLDRHETLRTSFQLADTPVQVVHERVDCELRIADDGEPDLAALIKPFDLATAPLARASLHRSGRRRWLFVDLHHLIVDGASLTRLFADLDALYRGAEPPAVEHTYLDYAHWASQGEGRRRAEEQRAFWAAAFAGRPAPAELPTDRPRPAVRSHAGDLLAFRLGAQRTATLRALAARHATTPFAVLAAAYAVFLSAVTGQDDVTFGVPASGRTVSGLDITVGMFVNTVCLRLRPGTHQRFGELLDETSTTARGAFEHQDFPLGELAGMVAEERSPGRNPVFDSMLALQSAPLLTIDFLAERRLLRPRYTGATMFDLNMQAYEEPEDLHIEWEFSVELFDRATVEAFRDLLLGILDRALADQDTPLVDLVGPASAPAATAPVPSAADFAF